MHNRYKEIANLTDNPIELSKKVFGSILIYLEEYKDTSRTKEMRRHSLMCASEITHWVLNAMQAHSDSFEKDLVCYGVEKVYVNIQEALGDFNKVHSVSDSIGFLRILSTGSK